MTSVLPGMTQHATGCLLPCPLHLNSRRGRGVGARPLFSQWMMQRATGCFPLCLWNLHLRHGRRAGARSLFFFAMTRRATGASLLVLCVCIRAAVEEQAYDLYSPSG